MVHPPFDDEFSELRQFPMGRRERYAAPQEAVTKAGNVGAKGRG